MGEYVGDQFEWDEEKSEDCLQRRGFDFEAAKNIFFGLYVEWPDDRWDYGEDRNIAVGFVEDCFTTLVYTERNGRIRIISAWYSTENEKERFMEYHGIEKH